MKRLMGGLGLGTALLVAGSADALVIDTFELIENPNPAVGEFVVGAGNEQNFTVIGSPVEILDNGPPLGRRTLFVSSGSGAPTAGVLDGALGFSAGAFAAFVAGIRWEGDGNGLPSIDLTVDNPLNIFTVSFSFIDGPATIQVTLTDETDTMFSLNDQVSDSDIDNLPPGQNVFNLVFELDDFTGVDVTAITEIELEVSGPTGTDLLAIESVAAEGPNGETILPAPATLLLLGAGLTAFGFATRRRVR